MIIGNFGCEFEKVKFEPHDIVYDVDIRTDTGATHHWDLSQRLPVEDNFFDRIYSSHCLEHFSFRDIEKILFEWKRVLKINGEIEIVVPSFEFIVEQYQLGNDFLTTTQDKANIIVGLLGGQMHPYDFHKCVFDAKSLNYYMERAGFRNIEMFRRNFWGFKQLSLVSKAIK